MKTLSVVPYGINIRTISAFKEIGQRYAAVETFCGLMNMLLQMNKPTYQVILLNLHIAIKRDYDLTHRII